jgi:hypothetical protein
MGLKELFLDEEDQRMLVTIKHDIPFILERIERIEINVLAMSKYMSTKNPELYLACLRAAKLEVETKNKKLKTKVPP